MEILVAILIGVGALAAVLYPAMRLGSAGAGDTHARDAALDRELEPYRTSLRAGTLCNRCHTPNPDGSRYCAQCGRALGDGGGAAAVVEAESEGDRQTTGGDAAADAPGEVPAEFSAADGAAPGSVSPADSDEPRA